MDFIFFFKIWTVISLLSFNLWNSSIQPLSMWKEQRQVRFTVRFCWLEGPLLFVPLSLSTSLSLSALLPPALCRSRKKKNVRAEKNTSPLNFKTTLMFATANSLWLKNLANFLASEGRAEKPNALISEGARSGGWCLIEQTGSRWWRGFGGGGWCAQHTRQEKATKVPNFLYFWVWTVQHGIFRSEKKIVEHFDH